MTGGRGKHREIPTNGLLEGQFLCIIRYLSKVKLATFNINNVNKRLANLIAWLREAKPDVVSLQELKATDKEFPREAIEKEGYGVAVRGQKSWNGVAILARGTEPIVTRTELPG